MDFNILLEEIKAIHTGHHIFDSTCFNNSTERSVSWSNFYIHLMRQHQRWLFSYSTQHFVNFCFFPQLLRGIAGYET